MILALLIFNVAENVQMFDTHHHVLAGWPSALTPNPYLDSAR
jgi:hypothetical protein